MRALVFVAVCGRCKRSRGQRRAEVCLFADFSKLSLCQRAEKMALEAKFVRNFRNFL